MRRGAAFWTSLVTVALGAWSLCALAVSAQSLPHSSGAGWPTYGGDAGGQRYSDAAQITRANVARLRPAWTYHTHALETGSPSTKLTDFEATPILFGGLLYLSTPFDRVIALDPATGVERWSFDPQLPADLLASNVTSRGVAAWPANGGTGKEVCAARIFVATLDARLIAMDAATGKPCEDFGKGGQVDLKAGVPTQAEHPFRLFGNTSPPTVIGDVVVVGSAIGDNQAVEVESGVVRGYDARSGHLLWKWDPISWAAAQHPRTGAANAWSILAADPEHHLVYVPTGAPAPDFYGGFRVGDDKDANSVVALDARTGRKVWAFQLVHHDVWDYDVAAEPLLFEYQGRIPAIAVAAKTGIIFVLNRLTGEPLYPVTERTVPQGGVPGEHLSPTQPFSSLPPLNPLTFDRTQWTGHDAASIAACSDSFSRLRYDGIYTPPSLQGTLQYPGSLGGVNWGSMSLDPATGTLYANTNGSAYEIRLLRKRNAMDVRLHSVRMWAVFAVLVLVVVALLRRRWNPGWPAFVVAVILVAVGVFLAELQPGDEALAPRPSRHALINSPDSIGEVSPNAGAPYKIFRRVLQDDRGRPCTPPPWGATAALNLNTGQFLWRKPLGTLVPGEHTGTVNFGAPIVTGGGLLFLGASSEPLLRALDKTTGEEVWAGKLPVPAQSTPMTYLYRGRQYVVISAGGHGGLGTPLGDSVVAFALP